MNMNSVSLTASISRQCGLLLLLVLPASSRAADNNPIQLPSGQELNVVDFERHVVPLLSRFGCNSGSCHGSFQGRGGMRFSLFGHNAKMDYDALSLRIDTDDPAESDALLKPTEAIEHEGGKRFERDSWAYQVMARWISDGGRSSNSPVERISLSVAPKKLNFDVNPSHNGAKSQQLTVMATINGEESIEVTSFCRFTSGDEGIVTVNEEGVAESVRAGATHLTVEYLGSFATVLTSSKLDGPTNRLPLANNFIDKHINAKLTELNLETSLPATDEVFIRRVTLDTVARLPTDDETRDYVADKNPDRDRRLFERLLGDQRHASLWATRLCDMTRCSSDQMEGEDELKPKRAKMWHDWFKVRLSKNRPYDQIVRGVICGTSIGSKDYDDWLEEEANLIRSAKDSFDADYSNREFLDLYWRRKNVDGIYPLREVAETTSAAFLGIQVECAQCHKHPYDHWTQAEYRSFVNVFSQVSFGSSAELNKHFFARMQERREMKLEDRPPALPKLAEIYNSKLLARPFADANTKKILPPKPLGGPALDTAGDPREQFMNWLVTDGKQQFSRNFANRVWAQYFGRGIVEPVDGFSAINPPTHPELLDRLASEFIESGYDIRHLEMVILSSAAYRRSSEFAGNNAYDQRHYSRSQIRPLMAETSIDVLHQVLGVSLKAGNDLAKGATAIDHGGDKMFGNTAVARMFSTFGRGPRKSACDCDRQQDPSLRQSLFQMSDPWVINSIREGQLMKDVLAVAEMDESIELAFQRVLARRPTFDEKRSARSHLFASPDATDAWTDLIWALVNTREFLTNR